MSVQLITKEVDGKVYEVSEYGAEASLDMLSRLTAVFGEPMLLVVAAGIKNYSAGKSILESEIDSDLIQKAVQGFVTKMGQSAEIKAIIKKLTSEGVLCDHKPIVFDAHFAGGKGLAHLMKVVRAMLEAHYGDFLGALFGNVGLSPRS